MFGGSELQVMILDRLAEVGRSMSRRELCYQTGFGRSAISTGVKRLLDLGLLEEAEVGTSLGGRRSGLLSVPRAAGLIGAVELGATSIDVAISTLAGDLLGHRSEPWDIGEGPEPTINRVRELLLDLLDGERASEREIAAIGVGLPGPVEQASGGVVAPPIMPGWNGFSVRRAFETAYSCPAFVDNDVNIMALGEHARGVGQGVDNLIFVKIGTGIGSGLIVNGQIYRGDSGCAGDIGHVAVDPNGAVCTCGNVGCLEAMAAAPAIVRAGEAAARDGSSRVLARLLAEKGKLDAADIGHAVSLGDRQAVAVIRECGRFVGQALASIVSLLNPSMIVIGGAVSHSGAALLAEIRTAVYMRSLPLATRNLPIVPSYLDARAGVTGASVMAIEGVLSLMVGEGTSLAELKRSPGPSAVVKQS